MAQNYYCLVAGLKEYTLESDTKGFDARAVVGEIREALSSKDNGYLRDFLLFYDIENLLAMRDGRTAFSEAGNLSREEMEEELRSPHRLPKPLCDLVEAYNNPDSSDYDEIDTAIPFDKALYGAYYALCAESKCRFIRSWSEADRNLRNLTAAFAARRKDMAVADVLVGGGDLVERMARSSAADFGLKGELGYVDAVMGAVADNTDLLDKEHRIDLIRWNIAEDLATFDYFNIDYILSYVERIELVNRWAQLAPERGRELFGRLVEELSAHDIMGEAEMR